ncbi:hypothetical protein SAMN04488522_101463 [Pedobacter caeni]|uniref:Uncharacterized protein n=2 Tax=Pedobacter caeni TaxID=288992 RepID=A0A1M4U8E0_9SPHI|nr:hypothetical protein SAMN04488522_101463 [Pedobacter caeni]
MQTVPDIEDKIEALYLFMESNLSGRYAEDWTYMLDPEIVFHLNSLSKEECENLVLRIWDWDADILICLADPFIGDYYSHLDGGFLYCKLFLVIENFGDLEYLYDNLPHAVSRINAGTQPLSFYVDLENKAIETFKVKESYGIDCIREKFDRERKLQQEKS